MTIIRDIISVKGSDVTTVGPEADVIDAIKTMAKMNIGSILVVERGKVVGIISDKDFSNKVIMEDRLNESISAKEVMSTPVVAIKPDQSIEDAMSIMTEKRVRHLPVMDDDQLVGLVSIGDLVKAIISEQESTIKQLEQYIYC